MSKFLITWVYESFAQSTVWAKNEDEAKKRALNDEDEDFEQISPLHLKDWRILKCMEVKNNFKP